MKYPIYYIAGKGDARRVQAYCGHGVYVHIMDNGGANARLHNRGVLSTWQKTSGVKGALELSRDPIRFEVEYGPPLIGFMATSESAWDTLLAKIDPEGETEAP